MVDNQNKQGPYTTIVEVFFSFGRWCAHVHPTILNYVIKKD